MKQVEPSHLVFKPDEDIKSISIYSTVNISKVHNLGESGMYTCPITISFYQTDEAAVPETCKRCFTSEHVGIEHAWKLNVTRTSFTSGRQESMFIRVTALPHGQLREWKMSKHEVSVSHLKTHNEPLNIKIGIHVIIS